MTDRIVPGDLLHRAKVINGLRQLADYLETHPDVPASPFGWDVTAYLGRRLDDATQRAEVDRIAAILGVPVADETGRDGHYIAERTFGLITYRAVHVPARRMAIYHAETSYQGCVTPEHAEVTS